MLRDVLENHRFEMEEGALAEDLQNWFKEDQPEFDWKNFGFQEFSEMLNFAQDKGVVKIQPDEKGLQVTLGTEFHPPALPDAPPPREIEPEEEMQPVVRGQPTAREPRVKRAPRKTVARAPSLANAMDSPDVEEELGEEDFELSGNVADPEPPPPPMEEPPAEEQPPVTEPEPEAAAPPKKAARKMPTKRAATKRAPKVAAASAEPEAEPAPPAPEPEEQS